MIYVASSWRNPIQTAVVAALKSAARTQDDDRFLPYDFKNPPGGTGFHWSEVGMPSYNRETNSLVPFSEYKPALDHPRAVEGFESDFNAMKNSWACVLVLPSGRSAHLEAGWFIGQGKYTAILLSDEHIGQGSPNPGADGDLWVVPELMYKMADYVTDSLFDLLGELGVED